MKMYKFSRKICTHARLDKRVDGSTMLAGGGREGMLVSKGKHGSI